MQQTKNLMLVIVAMFISVLSVKAQNPHFIGSPTITDKGNTQFFCAKLAGLGSSQNVTVTLYATATVTTECTNQGGNVAPGQTKTVTLSATDTYTADRNGTVTFCLETPLPTAGKCPNGNWTPMITDVSFTNSYVMVNGNRVR